MQRKRAFLLLQNIFLVGAFFFIALFISQHKTLFSTVSWKLNVPYLFLSFTLSVVSIFFLVKMVQSVFLVEGIRLPFFILWRFVVRSNLLRYIPGGVWNHAGLAFYIAENTQKSTKTTGKLILLFIGFQVLTGIFFAFFFLPIWGQLFFVSALIVGTLLFNFFLSIINHIWSSFIKKQKMILPYFSRTLLLRIYLYGVGFWIATGLSFVVFFLSLGARFPTLPEAWRVLAAYNVSWVAGFLFLPAPSGIGVREFVLGILMRGFSVGVALGVSFSLLFRIFQLIRDGVLFASTFLSGNFINKKI